MTEYFVDGTSGNNANNGTTAALAKATLTGAEALVLVGGDIVHVRAGVYRETHTPSQAGGSVYSTGTVSVTNGSAVVTGSGTSFTGNAFANGLFQSTVLASGTNGVTNGTGTFTSSGGNFQSSMIGLTIRISTKGAYLITAVASATSITIALPGGGAASPAAGSGLTYNIGPESPYELLSVDSNTQITLKRAWSGPTLTGIAYRTWQDIRFVGDEQGVYFATGGSVRITGSDNDQTATRSSAISSAQDYRTWRGFTIDTTTSTVVGLSGSFNIVEQCSLQAMASTGNCLSLSSATNAGCTVRRCSFGRVGGARLILISAASTVDNVAHLVENCIFDAAGNATFDSVGILRVGGCLVRNCNFMGGTAGVRVETALSVGQSVTVLNSIFNGCDTAVRATTSAEFIEDYNNLFANSTNRSGVNAGTHDQTYTVVFASPLRTLGFYTEMPGVLDPNSPLASIAGLFPPGDDLYGNARVATSSWGAVQYVAGQRPVDSGEPRGRRG